MITPRDIANKSRLKNLYKGIDLALNTESSAVRRNTQSFNNNRYVSLGLIDDYTELKDKARRIKEESIENLPELISRLKESVENNGGYFYLAKSAMEANSYIVNTCVNHNARLVVKGKSMTTEEIKLNQTLETAHIEVAETDLAEFILQYAGEQPSHIVAPALHKSREEIAKLFKEKFNPQEPLETGEQLTKFARNILREKFIRADVGITGANIIAADTGAFVLVESEGNIRLSYTLPKVHIAVTGVEKVIAKYNDLGVFIELLAPSGTGQPLTSYTSVIRPPFRNPSKDGEFHMVLVDNGRMAMRKDPVLKEALYCIRCSACLNSCANFQSLGGHAFGGETYSGGIGGSWEAGTGDIKNARFSELCSGCSRCVPQCPVKINIPWLNENIRQRITAIEGGSLQKKVFASYGAFARLGSRFPGLVNMVNRSPLSLIPKLALKVHYKRSLPRMAKRSFTRQHEEDFTKPDTPNYTIFSDVYSNYHYTERGLAALKILNALGLEVDVSPVMAAGRDALSQGEIVTAKTKALQTATYLAEQIKAGQKIIVLEPSILALFKMDYHHLLNDDLLYNKIKDNCFDLFEIISTTKKWTSFFNPDKWQGGELFYHSHCQEKTAGLTGHVLKVLDELGFKITTSNVECCGMAGSFGYKKQYYQVSKRVAEDLIDQITESETDGKKTILVTGISCRDQLEHFMKREVLHPLQLLERILK